MSTNGSLRQWFAVSLVKRSIQDLRVDAIIARHSKEQAEALEHHGLGFGDFDYRFYAPWLLTLSYPQHTGKLNLKTLYQLTEMPSRKSGDPFRRILDAIRRLMARATALLGVTDDAVLQCLKTQEGE